MRSNPYPSDLSDRQWLTIQRRLPKSPTGGRPREVDLREVINAIFYVLKTGCQWRFLPRDFPPKSTVWRYFQAWQKDGTWERIHDSLRTQVRASEKPYSPRRSASVDSQSVETSSGGDERGRDNAKRVDGRKRNIAIDSLGLLLAVMVTAASVDDARAAKELFPRLENQPTSRIRWMFADSKYHNHALNEWVNKNARFRMVIVRRDKRKAGWQVLPHRWMVERTFAWLKAARRLSIDRERTVASSETFVRIRMISLMLGRLHPKPNQPEFRYRKVA